MSDIRIRIIEEKAGDAIKQSEKDVASLKDRLMTASKQAQQWGAAMVAAGYTVKKIFDFGEQGAQLVYMEDKFNRLAASIGTTGEALKADLDEVTQGLMSDAELIGAAGDLMALGLAKSHDEAVRLTNVASQLGMNMNQLVLTLTNQTTMRFDALGVSVDGFKERMKSLEKQGYDTNDAFKEAFLQQAEAQLEKVGSVADTDVAAFMRLDAEVKNLKDSLAKSLAPALATAAEGMTTIIEIWTKSRQVFEDHRKEIAGTSKSLLEYRQELLRSAAVSIAWTSVTKGGLFAIPEIFQTLKEVVADFSEESYEASKAAYELAAAESEAAEEGSKFAGIMGKAGESAAKTRTVADKLKEALGGTAKGVQANAEAVGDFNERHKKYLEGLEKENKEREELVARIAEQNAQMVLNAALSRTLEQSMTNYRDIVVNAVRENEKLVDQYWELARQGVPETSEQLMRLNDQINKNNEAQSKALEAMRESTAQMIYQQAAQGLSADAALELARMMGLVSEEDYTVAASIQQLKAQFDANRDGMIDAAEGADEYTKAIQRLHAAVVSYQNDVANGGGDLGALRSELSNVAGAYRPASLTSAATASAGAFVLNYSPVISTASRDEAVRVLTPIIQDVVRQMR